MDEEDLGLLLHKLGLFWPIAEVQTLLSENDCWKFFNFLSYFLFFMSGGGGGGFIGFCKQFW